MMLWQAKTSANGTYTDMKTPTTYKIDWEDLDASSYRSVNTGNLVRSIVSTKWLKATMTFNYLTESEVETILSMINHYPLYVKIKSPLFGTNGILECQCYVSKVSVDMQQNVNITEGGTQKSKSTWNSLTFNLIQSKKVSGQ